MATFTRMRFEQGLAASRLAADGLVEQSRQLAAAAEAMKASEASARQDAWLPRAASRQPSVQRLLKDLQSVATSRGVELFSVATRSVPGVLGSPAQVEIAVTLRGRYASLLAALGEVLDRHRAVVPQRLVIGRSSTPTDLEAQATLLLPAVAEAADGGTSLQAR